ncbi:hypothetical protein HZA97_03950 [Candidatus Woesearchaeota archaeon]|nr:hypothetical protein [Candidatus Woesearchaeota archaeon]
MDNKETKEKFTSWYPLYTRHVLRNDTARASYTTLFFGIVAIAKYEDKQCEAWDLCLCEPLERFMKKLDGEKYIDSLDDLTKEIKKDRSNIRKVKFKW